MANKLPVKFYFHTMPGMPQSTNQYGDTVAILDVVLVNGTTPVSVVSITFTDGVCTATTSGPHGLAIDWVIEILGADQDQFNGEWRITDVTTNTFKFVPVVAPAVGTATGTITVRIPPLGYEIAFTGTNKRVYRSKNLLSTRPYIRVDNSLISGWTSTYAVINRVTAAKAMTDIDTMTDGRIPYDPSNPNRNETIEGTGTGAINGWFTWQQAVTGAGSAWSAGFGTSAAREWAIVGDDQAFYFHICPGSNAGQQTATHGMSAYAFGNFISYRANDPYDYFLVANEYRVTANTVMYYAYGNDITVGNVPASSAGMALPKDAFGLGNHTNFSLHHVTYRTAATLSNRTNAIPFPNGADFSIRMSKRYICDTVRGDLRGELPGQYFINQATPFTGRLILNNVAIEGVAGTRKFLFLRTANQSNQTSENNLVGYDITGPWR